MENTVVLAKDLPASGRMLAVDINGKSILIAKVGRRYYAIGNICTHMGCRLADGTLTGAKVQCPCHGSTFDVRTGAVVKGPAEKPEPSYALKIEPNDIAVRLQFDET